MVCQKQLPLKILFMETRGTQDCLRSENKNKILFRL